MIPNGRFGQIVHVVQILACISDDDRRILSSNSAGRIKSFGQVIFQIDTLFKI